MGDRFVRWQDANRASALAQRGRPMSRSRLRGYRLFLVLFIAIAAVSAALGWGQVAVCIGVGAIAGTLNTRPPLRRQLLGLSPKPGDFGEDRPTY